MACVDVADFCANPDAMFARVERGEIIEITREGKVIALATPPRRPSDPGGADTRARALDARAYELDARARELDARARELDTSARAVVGAPPTE